ncbi:Mov34/MPN/PAD-1 family protein [Bradyrhizobium pachyrhizi]|uniref:Mov34/MPN/PAD-1 family protein n=1 Tax=Bradyrhizobium pachyrhizi TaxID=280333 RepID=UPI0009E49002|nr:Mov34/MPN/PAD-1 family protein [Bradyrhizobium pachyrhizi]
MKLFIPSELIQRVKRELRSAGRREIGGVLVGEHIEGEIFRLVELSVQRNGGNVAHFNRDDVQGRAFVANYLSRTGKDPRMCNYLGEWHSHPLFTPTPSGEDVTTMFDIVRDPRVGMSFAVLIIARLQRWSTLQMSATVFQANGTAIAIDVEVEGLPRQDGWLAWVTRFFQA